MALSPSSPRCAPLLGILAVLAVSCSDPGAGGSDTTHAEPEPSFAYEETFSGGPVELVLRLDRTEIGLADRVRLEQELRVKDGFVAEFPEYLPEDFEGFAVVDVEWEGSGPPSTSAPTPTGEDRASSGGDGAGSDGKAGEAGDSGEAAPTPEGSPPEESRADAPPPRIKRFTLEPSRSGELTVAPFEVYFHRRGEEEDEESVIRSDEIRVTVRPLEDIGSLEVPPLLGILDAPPAEEPRSGVLGWAIGGSIGLLLAAILGWWVLFRRGPVRAIAPTPPHEVALENLRRLVALDLVEKGEIERFYVILSAILRQYVEDRFHVRAPELTTEEFFTAAAREAPLGPYRARLKQFLDLCDQVKFARFQPERSTIQSSFDVVKTFLRETTPHAA